MTETSSPRIFLSYARRDGQVAAAKLRAHLVDAAITGDEPLPIWQDFVSMRSGDWREQIRTAIKAGDHLLMVVTPGSLASQACNWEWYTARLEGAEISPVLAEPGFDLSELPKWLSAQHLYRFELDAPHLAADAEWQRLLASLRDRPRSRRMPTISRTPGQHFVARPDEMNALRDLLLDAHGDAVGITTAFTGSGGMGKTTLAIALAHDQRIQTAFYGGQLLVELGQQPDLLLALHIAIKDLTGQTSDARTLKEASERLAEALGERRVLLVIDDAWQEQHLERFMHGGKNCARLVTTRDEGVLRRTRARTQSVDQMSESQAVALLSAGLARPDIEAHRPFLTSLANRLGRCALLLELANGRIWAWAYDRGGLGGAIDEAEIEFRFKGMTAFDADPAYRPAIELSNPGSRNQAYADSLNASLDLLTPQHKARFIELAIFPEDTEIPYATVSLYWAETAGVDEREAGNLLDFLKRMSLVKGHFTRELNAPTIRLHDVIRGFMRDPQRIAPDKLKDLNFRFWSAHVQAGERAFADGTAHAYYAYMRLPWHLHEAGETTVLDSLLLQPGWLKAKLAATRSGRALAADYERHGRGQMQNFIGQTLQLTAGILARDPGQLLPQLIGRLMTCPAPEASRFLQELRKHVPRPAILTQRLSLAPPGRESARLESEGIGFVWALTVLPDGRLASASNDGTIRLWDVKRGTETARLEGHTKWVTSLSLLPDGQLASRSGDTSLRLWDIKAGKETARFEGHGGGFVLPLAALPDGRLALNSGWAIGLVDATRGTETARLTGHTARINAVIVLRDGRLASASDDKSIRLWSVNGAETACLEGHTAEVFALALLSDGRLASGSNDNSIRLWDLESGTETARLEGHAGAVRALAQLPDGRIASAATDGRIQLWDINSGAEVARLEGHTMGVWALAAIPDGRLASGAHDGTIRLWDVHAEAGLPQGKGRDGSIGALALLPDGRLASGSADGTISLWDIISGTEVARLEGHSKWIDSLVILADGRLASGSGDATIRIWDPRTGSEVARFDQREGSVNALTLLPDDRLAFEAGDGTIRLLDSSTGTVTVRLKGHSYGVGALTLLPDGRLASGSSDRTIRLWDLGTGVETARLEGHTEGIRALAVLPNGRLVSSDDDSIRIWNVDTGSEIGRIEGRTKGARALAVLPDGRLAWGSYQKTIELLRVGVGTDTARLEIDAPVSRLIVLADDQLVAGDFLGRLHWLEIFD